MDDVDKGIEIGRFLLSYVIIKDKINLRFCDKTMNMNIDDDIQERLRFGFHSTRDTLSDLPRREDENLLECHQWWICPNDAENEHDQLKDIDISRWFHHWIFLCSFVLSFPTWLISLSFVCLSIERGLSCLHLSQLGDGNIDWTREEVQRVTLSTIVLHLRFFVSLQLRITSLLQNCNSFSFSFSSFFTWVMSKGKLSFDVQRINRRWNFVFPGRKIQEKLWFTVSINRIHPRTLIFHLFGLFPLLCSKDLNEQRGETTNVTFSQLDSLLNPYFPRLTVWEISSIVEIDWNESIIARRIEDESRSSIAINPSIDSSILGLIKLNFFFLLVQIWVATKTIDLFQQLSCRWSFYWLRTEPSNLSSSVERIDSFRQQYSVSSGDRFHSSQLSFICFSFSIIRMFRRIVKRCARGDSLQMISLQFELIYLYRHGIFHSMLL